MRSAFLGVEPIPTRARELLQDAAAELRRLRDLQLVEPVDYALVLEIELALADDAAALRTAADARAVAEERRRAGRTDGVGMEDGAIYGPRHGLFRRLWNAMRGGR